MKYLLDTNVCITFFSQRNSRLDQRLAMVATQAKAICSVVKAELFYGAYKSQNHQANLARMNAFANHLVSLPFDDAAAQIYGELRAELERKGTPIGHHDLQIAAISLAYNLTLVTHNTREFSRVPNLLREDWEI
jgi:tRNA(fMet)-specific endonuclease VapC